MSTVLNQEINVVGCGRTDTGVHASDFMAHFEVAEAFCFDREKLSFKLNRFLPKDIAIHEIFRVDNETHARFDAISRTYQYRITKEKNPFRSETHWKIQYSLDIAAMNEAASILFEYIDFTSFSKLHTDVKTNNCRVATAEWTESEDEIIFTIKADRFLRNMVRAIVGTLVEVGRGKMDLTAFRQVIECKNRSKAGTSVPGQALFLTKIEYPKDIVRVDV